MPKRIGHLNLGAGRARLVASMQLYGWDTCYLARIDQVNAALMQQSAVREINFTVSLPTGNATVHLEFGAWQVVAGGAGELLRLSLPVHAGSLAAPTGTADLSGSSLIVQVSLRLLPSSTNRSQLLFDLAVAGVVGGKSGPGVVEPISMTSPRPIDTATQTAVLNGTATCLVAAAGQLAYVLASVNIVAPGSGDWLSPVSACYAYEPVSGGATYLAIFATVTQRNISQLPLSVDPEMVAAQQPAVFAISQDLFLVNVVQPLLSGPLGGCSSSYVYDAANHSIGVTKSVTMAGITEGLITYYPKIDSLAVSTDNQGLTIAASGHCDLKAGITMTFRVSARSPLTFDGSTQTIGFGNDPHPVSSHDADIPWYLQWLSPIVGLITDAVVAVIASSLASDITSALEGARLAVTPALAVEWSPMQQFTAESARIDGGYCVAGRL